MARLRQSNSLWDITTTNLAPRPLRANPVTTKRVNIIRLCTGEGSRIYDSKLIELFVKQSRSC
ncbi:MAG: hypothetical protein UT28_C0001G0020 [Berkelbacteria bacterium GW2011_GWE1_39_12]|uniref:Uncharacterized protein n=1 Tax=Berkelbacteria bacterium GW2011_GWE1_39_12 TaxID=1618337 RepID=A0A0G4B1Y1_9BACT|nr:MAG: hypothetical protein UT28_C0001G0020 [Berkelbacteria bacterium GW2011_GWE1_39_12]